MTSGIPVPTAEPSTDFAAAARTRKFPLPRKSRFYTGPGVISSCFPVIGGPGGTGRIVALMYRYDVVDKRLVAERVAQFRDQTRRFLAGELTEDEFRHLRLRNGLYIQRHAPMLRVAIPYGLLSSTQLVALDVL